MVGGMKIKQTPGQPQKEYGNELLSSGWLCTTPPTFQTGLKAAQLFHIQSQTWRMQPQRSGPADTLLPVNVSADWSGIS